MRLANPRHGNSFRDAASTFSQENRNSSFLNLRSVTDRFYRWLATTRFKVKGNTQTNSHSGSICFYSDREIMLNRYGNLFEANANNFFKMNDRPMMASRSYELKTNQYRILGQEYAEFDIIKYVDASATLSLALNHTDNIITVFHDVGDAPVFVTAGYSIVNADTGKTYYVVENEPVNIQILFNTFTVELNDDVDDIRSDREFIAAVVAAPFFDDMQGWYERQTVIGTSSPSLNHIVTYEDDVVSTGKYGFYGRVRCTGVGAGSFTLELISGNDFDDMITNTIHLDVEGNGVYTSYSTYDVTTTTLSCSGIGVAEDVECDFYYENL